MVRDGLSDLVASIKNGYLARLKVVVLPHSNIRESVAKILSEAGYVGEVKKEDGQLVIGLKYKSKQPVITEIVRVSKPGSRIYLGYKFLTPVLGGLGTQILSTPKGVMSDKQARKQKVGGEVICKVW